jgi:hypothetical protein
MMEYKITLIAEMEPVEYESEEQAILGAKSLLDALIPIDDRIWCIDYRVEATPLHNEEHVK